MTKVAGCRTPRRRCRPGWSRPIPARVADFCTAPGGKTAQLVNAGYSVTALDSVAQRRTTADGKLSRLGFAAEDRHRGRCPSGPPAGSTQLSPMPCTATGNIPPAEVIWHRSDRTWRPPAAAPAPCQRCRLPQSAEFLSIASARWSRKRARNRWPGSQNTLKSLELPVLVAAEELVGWHSPLRPDGTVRIHPGSTFPRASKAASTGFCRTFPPSGVIRLEVFTGSLRLQRQIPAGALRGRAYLLSVIRFLAWRWTSSKASLCGDHAACAFGPGRPLRRRLYGSLP